MSTYDKVCSDSTCTHLADLTTAQRTIALIRMTTQNMASISLPCFLYCSGSTLKIMR